VHVVPHHLLPHPVEIARRHRPFIVLTMADSRSSLSRKNPEGAIRAYHAAFGSSSSALLLLKLGGCLEDARTFEASVADVLRECNVRVIRGHLDEAKLTALYQEADVLLSLHRAEGYGLPMREAMAHGLPVVGTGWSGNLDFMTEADSCLVPYRLIPVSDAAGIYRDSVWAEPDIDAAAIALRRLAVDPDYRARLGAAAYRSVVGSFPSFPFAPE
jgi:glycosyltransferase involved in cell wall biosynthesis